MEMENVFEKMRCDTWQEREARFNELVKMYADTIETKATAYYAMVDAVLKDERVNANIEYAEARSRLQTLEDVFEVLEIMSEVRDKFIEVYCTDENKNTEE